ncbi:FG-GAP and VCBS repeat-containing protein [Streptomyces sp. NPDC008313]|uniref:FG-GAP and VCBS repeat-containing protein n=1 Tax=Streptomyces sp. NPDC008313 TaxID=3364826 RepID=UPI0036E61579
MRPRTTMSCCAVLLLAVTGCQSEGGSQDRPADARPSPGRASDDPAPGDFNGDGYDDLVDVVDSRSKDGGRQAQTLVVVSGSRQGLNTAWVKRVRMPAGQILLSGPLRADLDGDGFTDLVGSRGKGLADARTFALFGGARGLGAPRLLDLPPGFRPLAAADFDGDGSVDLLDGGRGGTGSPSATGPATGGSLRYGPFDRAGTARRDARLDLGQDGYASPNAAVTGDFDGDGRAEAVLTYSFDAEEDESAPDGLHAVGLYEGGGQGLVRDTTGLEDRVARILSTQDGPRVPAAGDADGDGTDDLLLPTRLAVAPADMPGTGGALTILYGAKSGLGTGRAETVIGDDAGDRRRVDFGSSPAVGDVNGDRRPDVVVNTPDFRRHDGKVTLLPGGGDGVPSAEGEQSVDTETDGLPGTPNPYHWNAFAHRPPLLDVNGDGHADAVVFGPLYEKRKGAYLVLRGTDAGFDARKARLFTPDDIGVPLRLR